MIRHMHVFEESDDAICVVTSQWISKTDIIELIALDGSSVSQFINGSERVGKKHAVLVPDPVAERLGWVRS
jgi:hypothetical protein